MKKIPLYNKKKISGYVLVDDLDLIWLSKYKWTLSQTGYARGMVNKKDTLMHRLILKLSSRYELTDHIDRNKLNNQKNNLRKVTYQQNNINRSSKKKWKGVVFDKRNKTLCWRAEINNNGNNLFLGHYDTPEKAAIIYNRYAKKIYGKYAYLNPIKEDFSIPDYRPRKKSSKYKGVSLVKNNKWSATIYFNGNRINIGSFHTEKEAAIAVNIIGRKLYKDNDYKINNIIENITVNIPQTKIKFSKYKYIRFIKISKKWAIYITVNKKQKFYGLFTTENLAYINRNRILISLNKEIPD